MCGAAHSPRRKDIRGTEPPEARTGAPSRAQRSRRRVMLERTRNAGDPRPRTGGRGRTAGGLVRGDEMDGTVHARCVFKS
ncbi:hypothetical protein NHX12_002024 [Muraenolepis orangiensis]|uniref:Uncharacterized protein n=1 Tax=Muraenolepis orangiensis TaxID=630683 RepID=A0A9Q0IHT3_9TELE|nr:hypothetical protein NHX12_002024 [Muraenolepis orangiensis]